MGELTSLALCFSPPVTYTRASDEPRSSTPESRIGRWPRALPVPSGASIIGVVREGEDQIGSRKIRALKS